MFPYNNSINQVSGESLKTECLWKAERLFRIFISVNIFFLKPIQKHEIPVFGSTSIFDVVVWNNLKESSLPPEERHQKMNEMFTGIIGGGVTDVFMMKDWRSKERINNIGRNNY